jgi:hypothetical protein
VFWNVKWKAGPRLRVFVIQSLEQEMSCAPGGQAARFSKGLSLTLGGWTQHPSSLRKGQSEDQYPALSLLPSLYLHSRRLPRPVLGS